MLTQGIRRAPYHPHPCWPRTHACVHVHHPTIASPAAPHQKPHRPPSPPPQKTNTPTTRDLTPHPQYAAFYKWLQLEYQADVVLHFGMHGTVEVGAAHARAPAHRTAWREGLRTGLCISVQGG